MANRRGLWLSTCVAVSCVGCEQRPAAPVSSTNAPPAAVTAQTILQSEEPPASPPASASSPSGPAASTPSSGPADAQPQRQAPARTPVSSTASASRIRLSAGIALAQTLPDGTSVLCSIDYQWTSGSAQHGVEYVWVVELANGQRLTGPANVSKPGGTIQTILHRVKPDQGPFRAAIFAKSPSPGLAPEQVSDFIDLKN